MATSKSVVFMTGKLFWAKILGDPRPNYEGNAREWTFEFEPDKAGVAQLKKHGLTDRLKDKYEDQGRGKFLTLKKKELDKDGRENPPIRIYDDKDEDWDKSVLIGNGSVADVKVDIRDYGPGKKKGIYPIAVRVTDLVQYQSSEFGAMEKAATKEEGGPDPVDMEPHNRKPVTERSSSVKDTFKKDFGLEDDLDEAL